MAFLKLDTDTACMMRRVFRVAFCMLVFSLAALPCKAEAASAAEKKAFKATLQEVLAENPELVLDVLKSNSEAVLEIAQQGNILRKRKGMMAQWERDALEAKNPDIEGRSFRGSPKASVTIVAYSDFTCPYCRQGEQTLIQLLNKYDGTIRVTFKALPKEDPVSLIAAKYATAAFMMDPIKGWSFFDGLFAGMDEFEQDGEVFLKSLAEKQGYDFKKLKTEAGGAAVQARLDADRKEADRFGINGTPYYMVDNLLVRGAVSKELFEEAIEMALAKKKK